MGTNHGRARRSRLSEGSASRPLDYALLYPGKLPAEEVLRGPRSCPVKRLSVTAGPAPWRNRLYCGDNLGVLRSLCDDSEVCGRVSLVYIDPPFATGARFESRDARRAYDDEAQGAAYLEFLRRRLILLRELLAPTGSLYVHLDGKMAFPVKVLLDEVFGPAQFRNWITRRKSNRKNFTRRQYGNVSDYLLFYTKTGRYTWNRPYEAWTEDWVEREYPYVEPGTGRRYKKVPVHAPGVRRGETGRPWRGRLPPPGKHWQYPPAVLDALDSRGEVYWSPTGNPRRKVYFDQSKGVPVQDVWLDCRDAHNQMIEVTGYPTEKNLDLLRRIVGASSDPGQLVLDCFMGSGTTLAAAEELGRRWVGIDAAATAVATTLRRLARGPEPMGDFVNGKKREKATGKGPDAPALLRTCFDLYTAEGGTPRPPAAPTLRRWAALFPAGSTSLSE
jgi:adenine-specific DNA-methyltransferase